MKKTIVAVIILMTLTGAGCQTAQAFKTDLVGLAAKLKPETRKDGTVIITPTLRKKMSVVISDNNNRKVITEMQPGDSFVIDKRTGEVLLIRTRKDGVNYPVTTF